MAERYWITGVQIAMLKMKIKDVPLQQKHDILRDIENKQFIGRIAVDGKYKIIIKKVY